MISVIIPAYNRYNRLNFAINSVLNQTYKNLEILVVDGGARNKISQLIDTLNDSRIKYIKNTLHAGVASSRHLGVLSASNDLIAFLDDDDTWENNKLELQYNQIKSNPRVDMVLCDYTINNLILNKKRYLSMLKYEKNFIINILSSPGPFYQCVLIKKNLVLDNALFDENSVPSEDWDFFISLSKKNILVKNINKSLFSWNLSSDSQSSNLTNEANAIGYVVNKHKNYIPLN